MLLDAEGPEVAGKPATRVAPRYVLPIVAIEEYGTDPGEFIEGDDGERAKDGYDEQIEKGWGKDAESPSNIEVPQRNTTLRLFFIEHTRGDENAADGEKGGDTYTAIPLKSMDVWVCNWLTVVKHDRADGDGSPAVKAA
jgi:hypothetical protein